jgi:xanthine dehydrogenase small subunit
VEAAREDVTLLEVLREDLGVSAVKDGCSPQGQCGCCTVLVDGAPRVSCVLPVRRVAGRSVVTVEGLDPGRRDALVAGLVATGGSQCGFCTPGILTRLAALPDEPSAAQVDNALLAHLCRCTGWRSIVSAVSAVSAARPGPGPAARAPSAARATLEGGTAQSVGPEVVLGRGGFADDTAPPGALVAVPRAGVTRADLDDPSAWATGANLAEARAASGKVQGRRSNQALQWPVAVPAGAWDITLQTTWIEPAYLETDASWCVPEGEPASPVANGGAFGAKADSPAPAAARLLSSELQRPVRVVFSREDSVRLGSKRPPAAGGVRLDGTGSLVLLHPSGGSDFCVQNIAVATTNCTQSGDPPALATSMDIRGAGWAEASVLSAVAAARAAGEERATVTTAAGARATAAVITADDGWPIEVAVEVDAGDPLDLVTLASYVQGAAHMALGWVCSEGLAVGEDGLPTDLTIRSFGVLRAKDTPPISVTVVPSGAPPVAVSDAAFAAVAAATWLAQGLPSRWPTMRGTRR